MLSTNAKSLMHQLRQLGIEDENVLDAIVRLPRHLFVSEALAHQAYGNNALPIGFGQTISQPYTVAKMTELLNVSANHRVLEIGTGSGFQTCVLAQLVEHVYSVERIKSLQMTAKRRFKQLEHFNISTKHGNGWEGWASKGPFDAIIVTAAAMQIPDALFQQLKNDGTLVIPVGQQEQTLYQIVRKQDNFTSSAVKSVNFVPLINGELA